MNEFDLLGFATVRADAPGRHVESSVDLFGAAEIVAQGQKIVFVDVDVDFAEQNVRDVRAFDNSLFGRIEPRAKILTSIGSMKFGFCFVRRCVRRRRRKMPCLF